jgi:hypothetical protein
MDIGTIAFSASGAIGFMMEALPFVERHTAP